MTPLANIRQRLWLAATLVAVLFTVLVGGVGVLGGEAFAAGEQESCCCSSEMDKAEAGASHHQKMQADSNCHDTCQDHGCNCHIAPANSTPTGNVLALSSSTISFAPALAAQDHVQQRLPKPRAPSRVSPPSAATTTHYSPPIFLLHQTFLI